MFWADSVILEPTARPEGYLSGDDEGEQRDNLPLPVGGVPSACGQTPDLRVK